MIGIQQAGSDYPSPKFALCEEVEQSISNGKDPHRQCPNFGIRSYPIRAGLTWGGHFRNAIDVAIHGNLAKQFLVACVTVYCPVFLNSSEALCLVPLSLIVSEARNHAVKRLFD